MAGREMITDQILAATTVLKNGGIAVLRTDTLYGVLARADNEAAVRRVYEIKGRDDSKSPIVLISSYDQLFDIPDDEHLQIMQRYWPGPVSIIVPSILAPDWITRGNESVAYRMPDNDELLQLLQQTGPLIAPSANPQGLPTPATIDAAVDYFGDAVDVYVDGGEVIDAQPSQLLRISAGGDMERLR